MRWKLGLGALVTSLAMTMAAPAAEAQLAARGRPQHGAASLRQGFMPDPHILRGTMGGPVRASQVNSSCRGHITPNPSHVIRTRTGFRQIRFVVNGARDSTLLVMLPNGQVICDDDGGEGTHALISTSSPPGRIRVWVGSYSSSSTGQPYTLGVTELGHIAASNLPSPSGGAAPSRPPQASGLSPQMPPGFGRVALRSGFMPDPHVVSGVAGGPVSASSVSSSCRGHVTPQPSHVIQSPTGFRSIRFVVNSSTDTTLLVMLPNGNIVCDDDGGNGLNPLVATNSPPGAIRVWVGTYSGGRTGRYNLGISELSSVGTSNIPQPGQGGPQVVQPQQPTPPQQQANVVQMQAGIPVTLMGPGMTGTTIAVWDPRGGPSTRVQLNGRSLVAGGVTLGAVPPTMRDPVVTVTQRRNGSLVLRAEQPGSGRGDPGQAMLLLVRWAGRPTVANRWTGTARQRGPRWGR
ncbi:MAG TPA: hypothetical protein RMH99_07505 [Sandaracinaceae bacterium LLY-WYZ-13_1]|nr:hypothetical protein [Sandaracinaceae bacterium LLY-WYZ-13_1]